MENRKSAVVTYAPAFVAFFLSGASSLIFQSIWSRMLAHVFGASSVAISTVVTVFMAGLGLGAYFAGKYADRIKHPLLTYAAIEVIVGLWALIVPLLVSSDGFLASVNATLRASLGAESAGFMLARFACVVPILLVPTTLMGASLPLLSRHFVARLEEDAHAAETIGSRVGGLYAVNTLGAVCGVCLAGFVLMPNVGVSMTNAVAVGMNLFLGLSIFLLRKPLLGATLGQGESLQIFPSRMDAKDGAKVKVKRNGAQRATFFAFAASGAAALCYEVVWTRSLAMTIGSSVYSFTIILLTFLVGIASGSALASAIVAGRKRLLIGVLLFAETLCLIAAVPWAMEDFSQALLIAGVFGLPVAVIGLYQMGRVQNESDAFRESGVSHDVLAAMIMLAIPLLACGYTNTQFDGDLPRIVSIVVVCLTVFAVTLVILRKYPILQLASVQLVIASAALANYAFQDDVPCAFVELVTSVPNISGSVGTILTFSFIVSGLCVLPATIGMGAMFPLTLRIWTSGGESVGEDVGTVYAGNTIGSIVGAWLPGFILLPTIGMERTIQLGMFLNLLLALLLVVFSSKGDVEDATDSTARPAWHGAVVYGMAVVIPFLIAGVYFFGWREQGRLRWNTERMTLGVFRVSSSAGACDDSVSPDIVYYKDGLSTSVSVERWERHFSLKNNGKVDASNGSDMPTQVMVSAYPLLMHRKGPTDLDVAVVGFGSGVSVGAAMRFPVKSVDVVELERSIPDASRFFAKENYLDYNLSEFPFIKMDRLTIINDDGRNFLASTQKKYDVIISEPSNPWITGVSDLFTIDHFRITKRSLKKDGLYTQWVQLYEMSPENIKIIYRTFASQFKYAMVFSAEDLSSDTILLGSDSPLSLDLEVLSKAFALPGVETELSRAFVRSPTDVFARTLLSSKKEILAYTQVASRRLDSEWTTVVDESNGSTSVCDPEDCKRRPVELNTDDNALIEFAAPKDLIGFENFENYYAELYSAEWPWGRLKDRVSNFGSKDAAAKNYGQLGLSLIGHGRKREAAYFLEKSHQSGSSEETKLGLEILTLMAGSSEPTVTFEEPTVGPQLTKKESTKLQKAYVQIVNAVNQKAYPTAMAAMEDISRPIREHSGPSLLFLYGYLKFKTHLSVENDTSQDVIDSLSKLLRENTDYAQTHPELHYYLARAHDRRFHFDNALKHMRLFVDARRKALVTKADVVSATDAEGISDKVLREPVGAKKTTQ